MGKADRMCYFVRMDNNLPNSGAPKKGLSGWAWAGIGCGSVLLIGVIAFVLMVSYCNKKVTAWSNDMQANPERKTAEMVIGIHPEYSVVSSNDDTKQMTIKEDKTGKETTFSYKDIADGKFEMTTSTGEKMSFGTVDITKLPAWLVLPADAKAASGMQTETAGKASGMVVITTSLTPEELKDFFQKQFDAWPSGAGSSGSFTMNGVAQHTIEKKADDKEVTVMIQTDGTSTTGTLTYSEK